MVLGPQMVCQRAMLKANKRRMGAGIWDMIQHLDQLISYLKLYGALLQLIQNSPSSWKSWVAVGIWQLKGKKTISIWAFAVTCLEPSSDTWSVRHQWWPLRNLTIEFYMIFHKHVSEAWVGSQAEPVKVRKLVWQINTCISSLLCLLSACVYMLWQRKDHSDSPALNVILATIPNKNTTLGMASEWVSREMWRLTLQAN